MAPWLIGYGLFLIWLFTICTVTLGLTNTVWGFIAAFTGCAIAVMALWRRDEQQWKASFRPGMTETYALPHGSSQNQDWLALKDYDFDLLQTYTQDITKRVEAVYPLVDRDHIHKIVWLVMIELFCKRIAPSSHNTPASVIAAKMTRAG